MRHEDAQRAQFQQHRVRQELAAGPLLEPRAQEEVAVAAQYEAGNAGGRIPAQCCAYAGARGFRIVVADPCLEEVAQYVQRSGNPGLAFEEGNELRDCLPVQRHRGAGRI